MGTYTVPNHSGATQDDKRQLTLHHDVSVCELIFRQCDCGTSALAATLLEASDKRFVTHIHPTEVSDFVPAPAARRGQDHLMNNRATDSVGWGTVTFGITCHDRRRARRGHSDRERKQIRVACAAHMN